MSHFTLFCCGQVMNELGLADQYYRCSICGKIESFISVNNKVEKAKKDLIPPKPFWIGRIKDGQE